MYPNKKHTISIETYHDLSNYSAGYCLACSQQQDGVEPDAEGYECLQCGEDEVVGPDTALFMGLVY